MPPMAKRLLAQQGIGTYLGDKGFIFKPEVREELEAQGVHLITPKRSNMKTDKHEARYQTAQTLPEGCRNRQRPAHRTLQL